MNWQKKTVTKDGTTQIELRGTARGSQVLVIVALDGYNHKWYRVDPPKTYLQSTRGLNIHLAGNGGLQLTFAEWDDMTVRVAAARAELIRLEEARHG